MTDVEPLRDDAAARPDLGSEEAVCLFAITRSDGTFAPRLPEPDLERRLILHRVGSVAALIGIVPVSDYCSTDAERHLADIVWLTPRVRRHAALVDWAMQWSPVFPAPFGTLYLSLDSLTAFIRAHEATIVKFLDAVAGKEEWELRAGAHLDTGENLDRLARGAWPDWEDLTPGKRYMRLCRDKAALIERGRAEAGARVDAFVAELQPLAAAIRQLEAGHRPAADGAELIARYALLVARPDVAALQQRVSDASAGAAHPPVAFVLSGPWPPFSFRPNLMPPH